jgi:hypothetical protein
MFAPFSLSIVDRFADLGTKPLTPLLASHFVFDAHPASYQPLRSDY